MQITRMYIYILIELECIEQSYANCETVFHIGSLNIIFYQYKQVCIWKC